MIERKDDLYTIQCKGFTYQIKRDRYGKLIHTYFGSPVEGDASSLISYRDRGYAGNPYEEGSDRTYSYDYLPQEIGEYGRGDFRTPGIILKDKDGIAASDFRYVSERVYEGIPDISPFPTLYGEAETLEFTLADIKTGNKLIMSYTAVGDSLLFSRKLKAAEKTHILKAASLSFDILTGDYDLVSFSGRHCYERKSERCAINHQEIALTSRRGSSSHQANPFFIIADKNTDERSGSCFGVHLIWSSSFRFDAGKSQFGSTRINLSMLDEAMDIALEKGEELVLPAALLTYSDNGFEELSIKCARTIRKHAIRQVDMAVANPVLLNSWEACYFDFDGNKLISLATDASALGADLFVLDDGWFKGRNSDTSSLGDWITDESKLGMSLSELIKKIKKNNIMFGLWVEPEMVNEESDLYKAHPDWAFTIPGRAPLRSRSQLVLDLSRDDVRDYILSSLIKLLEDNQIDYIKWDMNRSLSDLYSATTPSGKILYNTEINLYTILSTLRERFPHLLIEGCAGGGGRYDLGMLCYTPQIWLSDNSDAIDRIEIESGSSYGYPVSTFGSHVSVCPNHQNGRITPLKTRSSIAMIGSYGLELDPSRLTAEEKDILKSEMAEYRKHAHLIKNGDFYRLRKDSECAAFAFVSEDREEALLIAVRLDVHGNDLDQYVKLRGLESGKKYRSDNGLVCTGSLLMNAGLLLDFDKGEYQSLRIYFKAE